MLIIDQDLRFAILENDTLNDAARERFGIDLQGDGITHQAAGLQHSQGGGHVAGLLQGCELRHLGGHLGVRLRIQRILILHLCDQQLQKILLIQDLLHPGN